jgi:hypothetical protein
MTNDVLPYRSELGILIRTGTASGNTLKISEEVVAGEKVIVLEHPATPIPRTVENRAAIRSTMQEMIAKILSSVAIIVDFEKYLERVGGDERGFSRALMFSEVDVATENIFGNKPRLFLNDWVTEVDLRRFGLCRSAEWNAGLSFEQIPLPDGEDESIPTDARDDGFERFSHEQRRIVSLINVPLWQQAIWRGMLYLGDPMMEPQLILV